MEGGYVGRIKWKMNVYTGEIPELPIGTENKNKWTRAAGIIFAKLSEEEEKERRRGGIKEAERKEEEEKGKGGGGIRRKKCFFLFTSGKM